MQSLSADKSCHLRGELKNDFTHCVISTTCFMLCKIDYIFLALPQEHLSLGFLTKPHSNQSAQLRRQARILTRFSVKMFLCSGLSEIFGDIGLS